MKPKVEEGITAFKNKFAEGRSTRVGRVEVVYMMVNEPNTHQIAKMKIMDQHYRKYILN